MDIDIGFFDAISQVTPGASGPVSYAGPASARTPGVSQGSYWSDMGIEEYHSGAPGVSSSRLKHMLVSPANYQLKLNRPVLENDILRIGHMLHTTVLEPHLVDQQFAIWTGGRRQGSDWDLFKVDNIGKTIITTDQRSCTDGMSDALYKLDDFPFEAWLHGVGTIPSAIKERSLFWIDEETGIECRARPDAMTLHNSPLAGDVKSTRSANREHFIRDIFNIHYDMQAAHYVAGIKAVYGLDANFVFFAVEKEAPYVARSFIMTPEALALGEKHRRYCLRMLKKCTDEGIWPKQPPARAPIAVEVPFFKDKDLLDQAAAYGLELA